MSKKLLLADDSITIQKVIGITFANEDYELTIVDNGDAALEKARAVRPDLVLADVFMPGKNGYELCAAIKHDPALGSTPVLLLTGTFEPFDENKARAAGADSWIAKPFESQALINRVEELLAAAAVAAPAPSPAVVAAAPVTPEPVPAFAEAVEELAVEPDLWGELEGESLPAGIEAEPAGEELFGFEEPGGEDLWGSVSFGEEDLGAEPMDAAAGEDIWGTLAEEMEPEAPAAPAAAEEFFAFEEEPLPVEAPPAAMPAVAGEEFFFKEEPLPATAAGLEWEAEEEIIPLDEVEILEEEELAPAGAAPLAEAFAFGEEEPFAPAAEAAPAPPAFEAEFPIFEEEAPATVAEAPAIAGFPVEEEFALTEEGPGWGIAEAPEVIEPAAPGAEEVFIASAEAVMEAPPVTPLAAPAAVETRVAALSEEQLAQIVERVAGEVIERLAGSVLERITWEVVPDLAESLIKEEIRKIRQGAQ